MANTKVLRSGLSRTIHPLGESRKTVLNQPSKQAKEKFPFYWKLPQDPVECLKWKIYCRKRCLTDLEFREAINEICAQDVAFFAVTFLTIFEPRPPRPLPLTLWVDQVDVLAWAQECYETDRDMSCLAGDTLVLTDRGYVPIIEIEATDKLWDGVEWVGHDGVAYMGNKEVIELNGVRLTPDHKILTNEGWKRADGTKEIAKVRLPWHVADSTIQSVDRAEAEGAMPQNREIPVYDILNCGPRHRFVAKGRGNSNTPMYSHNCEKSRGIGVSWLFMVLYYHKFIYGGRCKLGIMSKDEASLDGADESSIMGKFLYLHNTAPGWMRYAKNGRDILRRLSSQHMFMNVLTGATVQGFVPTKDKTRSGRLTSLFCDEFAFLPDWVQAILNSSAHVTNNRFFVSTWNGPDNEFNNICRGKPSSCLRTEMYWWNNSERWQGCYTTGKNGQLVTLDKGYNYPKDYPFELDGLMRSPWVDYELRKPGCDVGSALEELYGLQGGDHRKLIKQQCVDIIETTAKPPIRQGEILQNAENETHFMDDTRGSILLWDDVRKLGPYSAGCDLGFGRDASYSTLEMIDLTTGRQVAEIARNDLDPVEFAQYVLAFVNWVNGKRGDEHTYLTFEQNGDQAVSFTRELVRAGYGNVERSAYKSVVNRDETSYMGQRNKDGGLANLLEMSRAILTGELTVLSDYIRQELSTATKDERGRPSFPKNDLGHGDRSQGMGMAWNQARKRLLGTGITDETNETGFREPEHEEAEFSTTSWESAWSFRGQ